MTKLASKSRKPNPNRGAKPGERRGGRQKGTPNKLSADVKAMVLEALDKAGGANYLFAQAHANPTAFMTLVGKVLPMQVQGDANAPLTIKIVRGLGE